MTTEVVLLSVAAAIAAGLIGSFAVMRGMSLAADPLSHVALPGIGVALALHREPLFGAVAALLLGAFLVWVLQGKARATTEAIIGVVFSAALAIGSFSTSGENLIDALFGGGGTPSVAETVFVLLAALTIAAFVITIGIGLHYLGVLLMGALIIIPAVTAKGIARNIGQMLWMTVALAALATTIGTLIASWLQQETGPIIVLVAAGGFLLSLLVPRANAATRA